MHAEDMVERSVFFSLEALGHIGDSLNKVI